MDGGAWWAAVLGVAKSRTWLSNFTVTFHFPALEKEMATHSSVLAWRIPGTGEPGGLLSMGSHRVRHDWSDTAAAAAAAAAVSSELQKGWSVPKFSLLMFLKLFLFADWNYERKSTDFICQTETQVCQYSKIWRKSFKSMVCYIWFASFSRCKWMVQLKKLFIICHFTQCFHIHLFGCLKGKNLIEMKTRASKTICHYF